MNGTFPPERINRAVRYSTRGRRRQQSSRRMKVIAGLYILQAVIVAGTMSTARRLASTGGGIQADEQLRRHLSAMRSDAGEALVVLAGWAGACVPVLLGLAFCLTEFRKGGNRSLGARGVVAGVGILLLSIFWPLAIR